MAEEKSKLEDVCEVLSKRELATKEVPREDLPAHRKSDQMKHSAGKDSISSDEANQFISSQVGSSTDVVSSRMTDHKAVNMPQHLENYSCSTTIEIGGAEMQQQIPEIIAESFVPLVGGLSSQFNSIMNMQTCSQCHKVLCGETLRKDGSDSVKIICKNCTDDCAAPENGPTDKVVTVYRCGVCFTDFFERDVLAGHMDEKHKVPPEPTSDTVMKTSAGFLSNMHPIITNPSVPNDMGLLCPPMNLLLQNVVLQPRPAVQTFNSQNILVNATPMLTLQPSNVPALLTSAPQTSTFVAPAEVLVDPGKVLLPTPVPKVAIPKLNSMNKASDNNKILSKESAVDKTEVKISNMQSPE